MSEKSQKTFEFKGEITLLIKKTSQGIMGILKEYPIIVESKDLEGLQISLSKALTAFFINYPKEISNNLKISELTA